MNPVLQQKETKKKFLWGALAALNAPLGFLPALEEIRACRSSPALKIAEDSPYQRLPEDHLLAEIARSLSEKDGINLAGVYLQGNGRGFVNARVIHAGQKNMHLFFDGNPLQVKGGDAITLGAIGHELGHAETRAHSYFLRTARNTASTYGLMAKSAALMGMFSDQIKAIDPAPLAESLSAGASSTQLFSNLTGLMNTLCDRPLMLGTACVLFTASAAIPYLSRAFAQNTEYIADLHSAELAGPGPILKTLEYLERKRPAKDKFNAMSGAPPSSLRETLSECWNEISSKVTGRFFKEKFDETHPPTADRIETIKKAYPQASSGPGQA